VWLRTGLPPKQPPGQEEAVSEGGGSESDSGTDSGSHGKGRKVGGLRSQVEAQALPPGRAGKRGRLHSDEAVHGGKVSKRERTGRGGDDREVAPAGRQNKMRGLFGAAIGKL